jgi:hypothetical protein
MDFSTVGAESFMDFSTGVVIVCIMLMVLLEFCYNSTMRNCKLRTDVKKYKLYMLCFYCMCILSICVALLYTYITFTNHVYSELVDWCNDLKSTLWRGTDWTSICLLCFAWILHVICFESDADFDAWSERFRTVYVVVQGSASMCVVFYSMNMYITAFKLEAVGCILSLALVSTLCICSDSVFKVVNPFSWVLVVYTYPPYTLLCWLLKKSLNKLT